MLTLMLMNLFSAMTSEGSTGTEKGSMRITTADAARMGGGIAAAGMGIVRNGEAGMDRATDSGVLSLVRLLQFGDSMLPTGAFAFSGALESAVQKEVVHDAATLQQYVVSALRQSSTGDAVGLDRALRRLCADPVSIGGPVSDAALTRLRSIDLALYRRRLPEEFRDMMTRTGRKLAELSASMTRSPLADRWMRQLRMGSSPGSYPVSLAVLFAASSFSFRPLLHAEGSAEGEAEVEAIAQEALTVYFYG